VPGSDKFVQCVPDDSKASMRLVLNICEGPLPGPDGPEDLSLYLLLRFILPAHCSVCGISCESDVWTVLEFSGDIQMWEPSAKPAFGDFLMFFPETLD